MKLLRVRNQQRARIINTAFVRSLTRHLLDESLGLAQYELSIHFISATSMARMNQQYLQHEGSTDVITFDYREGYETADKTLHLTGEIFISVHDAATQAIEFNKTFQEEVVRYIVHGVLHLRGYDDLTTSKRNVMKKEENRLLRELSGSFDLRKVGR